MAIQLWSIQRANWSNRVPKTGTIPSVKKKFQCTPYSDACSCEGGVAGSACTLRPAEHQEAHWIIGPLHHQHSYKAESDHACALLDRLANEREQWRLLERAQERERGDHTRTEHKRSNSKVHLRRANSPLVGASSRRDAEARPQRTMEVPQVSAFANSRGKTLKSTARMQMTVMSIMWAR